MIRNTASSDTPIVRVITAKPQQMPAASHACKDRGDPMRATKQPIVNSKYNGSLCTSMAVSHVIGIIATVITSATAQYFGKPSP